jgi:hypothetical protein
VKKFEGDEALEEHKKIRLEEKSAFEFFLSRRTGVYGQSACHT